MSKATRPVNINGVQFDANIEEELAFEADIPEYPIESGFVISDAILLRPKSLTMTLYLTNTPVTWANRFGASNSRPQQVLGQLESLYFAKTPVTVVTSEKTYANMGITSLSIVKSFDIGYAKEIHISLKEIRTTSSATVSIPSSYGKSGKTGTNAGDSQTSQDSIPSSADTGSILFNVFTNSAK